MENLKRIEGDDKCALPIEGRDKSFDGLLQHRRRSVAEAERSLSLGETDRLVLPLALSLARLCARLDAQAMHARIYDASVGGGQ